VSEAGGPCVPVLEIGGSHVLAAVVDTGRWMQVGSVHRVTLDPAAGADELVARFAQAGAALAVQADLAAGYAEPARHWAVAIPDPFDYPRGIGRFREVGKFASLDGVDLRARLLAVLPWSPTSIGFVNDADAYALGEWWRGAGAGSARCVGITLGTGVGSGWIADGRVVDTGPDVPPGGRANRLSVHGMPLEEAFSSRALRRRYFELVGEGGLDPAGRRVEVREIASRARDGDGPARTVLRAAANALGAALGEYLHRFGPDVVVLGGSMAGAWDLLGPPFLDAAARSGWSGRTEVSTDPDRAATIGAAFALCGQS
jgi:glucokinase